MLFTTSPFPPSVSHKVRRAVIMEPSKYRCNLIAKVVSGEAGFRYGFVYRSAGCGWGRVTRVCTSPLLAGVIFEKYILVFQIQIFGFKYKIQEGLKPDRNNAREGRIVGRDAEGARRGLCAACPPRPRGATAAWQPDRLQWQIVQVVPSRLTSVRTQWHTGPGA